MTAIRLPDSPENRNVVAQALRDGKLVAFPTDTVYGLAATISDTAALRRIYHVKVRSISKALVLMVPDASQLDTVVKNVTLQAQALVEAYWPGALTVIFQKADHIPKEASPLETVGVRIPDHPLVIDLLQKTGPLAVTSANLSGLENASNADQVFEMLGEKIDYILDGGETPSSQASTVVDCSLPTPKILRPGPITAADIQSVISGM